MFVSDRTVRAVGVLSRLMRRGGVGGFIGRLVRAATGKSRELLDAAPHIHSVLKGIPSDYFVRHAYFLGQNDPYKALRTTLKAEIDEEAWATLNKDVSRPFDKPVSGRIAVKVINHLGDEVMKVFRVN